MKTSTPQRRPKAMNPTSWPAPPIPSPGREARRRPPPRGLPIDPRIRQRRVEVQRHLGRRRLRNVVALVASTGFILGSLAVMHSSLLGASRLSVVGASGREAQILLAAAGIRRGEPLIDIAPASAARRLEAVPSVGSARVSRSWPSSVTVTVKPRSAVGQEPVTGPTGAEMALMDVTGRVLAYRRAPVAGIPLLVGLGAPPALGQWLPGAPGAGLGLGAPATLPGAPSAMLARAVTPVGAALAVAGAMEADGVEPSRIVSGRTGLLAVLVSGGVTVVFGPPTQLGAKVSALAVMVHQIALAASARIDLAVPDRPTVSSTTNPASGPKSPGSGS